MHYDDVLAYVRKVLENSHIPTVIYEEPFEEIKPLDKGLRKSLYKDFDEKEVLMHFSEVCKENTVYYFTDNYYCSYVCMQLPNSEKLQYFIIGPFTYVEINQKNYLNLLEKLEIPAVLLPALENYYYNITFVHSEVQFKNLINTLSDVIWKGIRYSVSVIHGNPWNMPYDALFLNDLGENLLLTPTNMEAVESRYTLENQLMQAVSQGNLSLADQLLSNEDSIR